MSEQLTRADIEALAAMEKSVPAQPWTADCQFEGDENGDGSQWSVPEAFTVDNGEFYVMDEPTSGFIAALRNAAPALFALALDGLRVREANRQEKKALAQVALLMRAITQFIHREADQDYLETRLEEAIDDIPAAEAIMTQEMHLRGEL